MQVTMQSHQASITSKQSGMFGRNGPLSCRQTFFGSQLNSAVSRAHIRAGPSRRSGGLTVRAEKVGVGTWDGSPLCHRLACTF